LDVVTPEEAARTLFWGSPKPFAKHGFDVVFVCLIALFGKISDLQVTVPSECVLLSLQDTGWSNSLYALISC